MAEILILNRFKTWPIWYSVKSVLLIWMIARYLAKLFFYLFFYNTQILLRLQGKIFSFLSLKKNQQLNYSDF